MLVIGVCVCKVQITGCLGQSSGCVRSGSLVTFGHATQDIQMLRLRMLYVFGCPLAFVFDRLNCTNAANLPKQETTAPPVTSLPCHW